MTCKDPLAFEEIYRVEKECYQDQDIASAMAELPGASITEAAKLKGKIRSARRQQTLWWPRKPSIELHGLKMRRPDSIEEDLITEALQVRRA